MSRETWQKEILRHFRDARGSVPEDFAGVEGFARNRRCGDEVRWFLELGDDGRIIRAGHQVAGCAITTATASLVWAEMEGCRPEEVRQLIGHLTELIHGEKAASAPPAWEPLRIVADLPARHSCVTVVGEALERALVAAEIGGGRP